MSLYNLDQNCLYIFLLYMVFCLNICLYEGFGFPGTEVIFIYLRQCKYFYVDIHAMDGIRRSEQNSIWEFILSFHHVDYRDEIQGFSLRGKCTHLMSHSPKMYIFYFPHR